MPLLGAAPVGNSRLNVLFGLLLIGSCCEAAENEMRDSWLGSTPISSDGIAVNGVGHLNRRQRVAMATDVRVRGLTRLNIRRQHVEAVQDQDVVLERLERLHDLAEVISGFGGSGATYADW